MTNHDPASSKPVNSKNTSPAATPALIEVALPVPLDQSFSYLPGSLELNQLQIGARIKVPFGSRRMIGVITELPTQLPATDYPLKQALELIDSKPVIDYRLMKLALWMSDYYLEPLGEMLSAMLPGLGETDLWLADTQDTQNYWLLTPEAKAPDQRHHRLRRLSHRLPHP